MSIRRLLFALILTALSLGAQAPEPQRPSGSSYVPMDHWIYPALDRLAALGYIPSQISGLRPWTRAECRRQVAEAEQLLSPKLKDTPAAAEARRFAGAVRRELEQPGSADASVVLESVTLRAGFIAGTPLNDSYHFGQTWRNDFGRPFGEGLNANTGITARAEHGRFFAAVTAEYQHAPARDAQPLAVRQAIARMDGIPVPPAVDEQDVNRVRAIEAYAGVRLGNFELSAGKQSLWWGPGYEAPLSFSNNAEPTKNFRASTVHPFRLPGPLSWLGQVRAEFVMGKLGGHSYTWRPWFNAQKVSFKLTRDLEMGFTRWSIFWGVGHPITPRSFFRNFVSLESPNGAAGLGWNDPGDRKGGFDFRYRLPGPLNWVTLYTDSYSDDDPSPLAAPRHAAMTPGIYFARVPGLPHLDLRAEVSSTQPFAIDRGGQFVYFNSEYRSGNTNYGYLLGSPVGRDGRAMQGWARYWFTPQMRLEFSYRQHKGSGRYLTGGSTQTDGMVTAYIPIGEEWEASANVQVERYWVPLLGNARRNASAWFSFTWRPKLALF